MKRGLLFMGIGAGLMYLFDPAHGEERRNALRDRFYGLMPQTSDTLSSKAEMISTKAHDLTSKADGVAAEAIAHAADKVTTMIPTDEEGGNAAGGGNGAAEGNSQNGTGSKMGANSSDNGAGAGASETSSGAAGMTAKSNPTADSPDDAEEGNKSNGKAKDAAKK